MYAKTDGPVEREIDLGTVEYIESMRYHLTLHMHTHRFPLPSRASIVHVCTCSWHVCVRMPGKGGSMETKDFNIVTKSEELQFAAPSCKCRGVAEFDSHIW
jgi:hypothetical protein